MAPEPGITPDALTAEFRRSIDQVSVGVRQIIDGYNQLIEEIRDKRWLLGGPALLWIKGRITEVHTHLQKIVAKAEYLIEHSTPVVSLIITSFDWLDQVQKPASAVAGRVPVKDDKLVYWKGEAAEAYAGKLPFQQAAATDMATKADFISTWLFTLAKANIEYAVKTAEYVSLVAGTIAQAAVDAASVFGIIEAINAVADAVGDIVEKALNQLFGIATRVVDLLKNARDATASINNIEKLAGPPAGTWPQAVNVG